MQQGYYSRAWNDIKNSPGWFGKLCLLALLDFIPIFGPIVAYGYLGGWARDIAWGVKSPLPARIFGNEDGKLYRRGWFVFAALFIYAAIAWALTSLLMGFAGAAAGSAAGAYGNGRMAPAGAGFDALGFIMGVLAFVVAIAIVFFALAGTARSVIYDRFSPAFQISTLWKMIKHDASGIVRILLMALLVGLIIGIVVFCAIFVVILLSIFIGIFTGGPAFMNLMSGSYDDLAYGYGYGYGSSDAAFLSFLESILPVLGMGILLLAAVCYLAVVGQMFVTALVFRAMGYWTQGFEVAKWGGQDAPLPFEAEQAQAAAAAAWQAQQQTAQAAAAQPVQQQPASAPVAQQPANAPAAQQPAPAQPQPPEAPVAQSAVQQQAAAPAPEADQQPASKPQQPVPAAPQVPASADVRQPAPSAPQSPATPAAAQQPASSEALAAPATEAPAAAPAESPAAPAAPEAPASADEPAKSAPDDGVSK